MPINPIEPRLFWDVTNDIRASPYFYWVYLRRAFIFAHWGLDGLAIGDAYKALLLLDETVDDSGEYHKQALDAENANPPKNRLRFPEFPQASLPTWLLDTAGPRCEPTSIDGSMLLAYRMLVYLLSNIGCLRSAWDFWMRLPPTGKFNQGHASLKSHLLRQIRSTLGLTSVPEEDLKVVPEDLPERGFVQRVLYPWNSYEPQRYAESNLAALNEAIAQVAPKLRAEVTQLPILSVTGIVEYEKQLGLVAAEDIQPGEQILNERSFLTANNRLYDPLCDACSGELPRTSIGDSAFCCPECDDTTFCSQACLDGALESYHPAVCGSDAETIAREPLPLEAADALYFLLVARALAFSQHQELHPLELKDTRFLWGEFVEPCVAQSGSDEEVKLAADAILAQNPTLPFNFKYNILYPIHYLEKMEIDIYATSEKYDFWVFESLFAKFRGVASGKVSAEGVPEVSAVHPLWCLANHSCSPNVRWNWDGNMRFWARTDDQLVKWGPRVPSTEQAEAGVRKGQDILSHYCDIDLDVQQRREWAQGALGGDCRCPRCLWEDQERQVRAMVEPPQETLAGS